MSSRGLHWIGAVCAGSLLASPGAVAATPQWTQQDRFAAAFGASEPAQPAERAVCDAILHLPTGPAPDSAPADFSVTNAVDGAVPAADPPPVPVAPQVVSAPRFLAEIGVPVMHTAYDARWREALEAGLSFDCASFVMDRKTPPASQEDLAAFNRLVNGIVSYAEDQGEDDWANAADTLRTGRGDCEDIAILKLQLLLAIGMPEDAVYLTLVHDTIRRRDHAIVIVRQGGRNWALDSVNDALFDADRMTYSYQAAIAFNGAGTWLFGSGGQAQRSVMASPNALSTGLRR